MNGVIDRLWYGSCEETEEHLSEHLEGELRGLQGRRVLRHISRCEGCRAVLRSLARTIEQLRSLGRAEPPSPSVVDAVVERIASDQAERSTS